MQSRKEHKIVARILKVNHAGEHGAIRIYGAQIAVARVPYPSVVPRLQEIRSHEIEHHHLFAEAMPCRRARPCRALFLWAWGGYLLGLITALPGPRMIWICTEAVETAVHRHLHEQLHFLSSRDLQLYRMIKRIQDEELSHLEEARLESGTMNWLRRASLASIGAITDGLIWLSTSGDSKRMAADLHESKYCRPGK